MRLGGIQFRLGRRQVGGRGVFRELIEMRLGNLQAGLSDGDLLRARAGL
jgi:hypothetical protein